MKKFLLGVLAGAIVSTGVNLAWAEAGKMFPDVQSTAYYSSAVTAMTDLGVINGYENGDFGPNDSVNRGQAAVMFQRYDESIKLLVQDYCDNHKLQMGMMATKDYQALCINRGYSAYTTPTQN